MGGPATWADTWADPLTGWEIGGGQLRLVFGDGFLGEFAEEGEGVGFVVGGFHHHEDGHAEEDGLNQGVEVEPGDALEDVAEHHIVEEPGDEEVQALKAVEADEAIVTEAAAGQHDDGRNPADARG